MAYTSGREKAQQSAARLPMPALTAEKSNQIWVMRKKDSQFYAYRSPEFS
jgi:hypothetical protein